MSYLDQASNNKRSVAFGIVVAIHALLGYAFATGLATTVATKVLKEFEVVEVVEPPKVEEEPPPPPPELEDPPPFVPPPDLPIELPPPPQQTITTQTEVRQTEVIKANVPTAPKVEAAPQPEQKPVVRVGPKPSGSNSQAISRDDYPPASVRAEETGTVGVKFTIGTDGKIVPGTCTVTKSSSFERLDKKTCELMERRFRYTPATEDGKPVQIGATSSFRWVLDE